MTTGRNLKMGPRLYGHKTFKIIDLKAYQKSSKKPSSLRKNSRKEYQECCSLNREPFSTALRPAQKVYVFRLFNFFKVPVSQAPNNLLQVIGGKGTDLNVFLNLLFGRWSAFKPAS
jgi:hypothetical protein